MKTSKLHNAVVVFVGVVMLVAGQSGLVAAATASSKAPTTVNNSANTLKISPVRSDVSINAGSSATVPVYVSNLTSTPISLKPIENDFVAGDEKGTPSIILDENSYAPTHSLKRFMLPLSNLTVPAKQTKEVDVEITVPKSAQAGGYFGAIRFAPLSTDGSQSVNLSASVASLILMTVPGDTVETLTLTNFDFQQDGTTASNFRTPKDLQILVRFQNKGNVQLSPFGQIYVKKGKTVVFTSNFNDNQPRDEILPDSYRRWTVPLHGFGKFGKYTVGATFGYGSKGQSLEIEKTVWIIPTAYIFGAIGGFIGLICIIVLVTVGLRSYKRKILRSHSRRRY